MCASPGANVTDGAEISLQEQYLWEIDTECDGTPNITVEVRGDAVNVFGAVPSGTDFDFNGTDLEVNALRVTLAKTEIRDGYRSFVGRASFPRRLPAAHPDRAVQRLGDRRRGAGAGRGPGRNRSHARRHVAAAGADPS